MLRVLAQKTGLIIVAGLLIHSCTNIEPPAYGDNAESGQYIESNASQIYFETYGDETKQALILIHGNGGSIKSMSLQIDFFKDKYFVIVADNRTHGKSGGTEDVTYDMMAEDYLGIMDELNMDSAFVLGHSDGGIIGLLLAINYPERIKKLVAAVPNLVPGEESIEAWELELGAGYRALIDSMILVNDESRNWQLERIHMKLMKEEPHITVSDLSRITCPVLVMTSDDDIIKPRHILQIYENIPSAQLFMMPGATHFMIRDEHELYNMISNRFLSNPFSRPRSKEVLMEMINP